MAIKTLIITAARSGTPTTIIINRGPAGADAVVSAESIAAAVNSAAEKTTPVDADQLAITDSAASGALKRLTFANLWAWISGKADARYRQRKVVVATSDEARTPNNTSYVADAVLSLYLEVGTWMVECDVIWNNGDDVCGSRSQLAFSGTIDTTKSPLFVMLGSSTGSNEFVGNFSGTRPIGGLGPTMPRAVHTSATVRNSFIRCKHIVVVTVAGNYKIGWGQGTASATSATTRKSGSVLTAVAL